MERGYPPTQAEIRDHFGFGSLNAVRSHLVLIEKKGYIRLDFGKAPWNPVGVVTEHRPSGNRTILYPYSGILRQEIPIWAEQNFEDDLPIPPTLFGGGELFALHVRGDSMTGAGIRNGDIAIIHRQDGVENGQKAAVLIEQEATLKRVYLSSNSLVLKADNPAFEVPQVC